MMLGIELDPILNHALHAQILVQFPLFSQGPHINLHIWFWGHTGHCFRLLLALCSDVMPCDIGDGTQVS